MKKFFISVLFIITASHFAFGQSVQLSENARVSVLTCGPGSDLYSAYGHSAFRIKDPMLQMDRVYNYGTFDFNAPNFYLNFAKGKLTYMLSTTKFVYFMHSYREENRWVKGQELNLTHSEVQAVFNYLENNAKPSNRSYQYDFFYDNCATKIEDVLKDVLGDGISFPNEHITTTKTHRDLIADYTSNFKWGKFGIDLALGSVIDRNATKDDYKFLPDYIFQAFENASITRGSEKQPLVNKVTELHEDSRESAVPFDLFGSPVLLFSLIALLLFYKTYTNIKNKTRSKWLDFCLLFISGLLGIAVLLLWFATTHTATYENFNFLWAFAPNTIVAFYMFKKQLPKWTKMYFKILIGLLIVMVVLWVVQIQAFNMALLPLVVAMAARYFYLMKRA